MAELIQAGYDCPCTEDEVVRGCRTHDARRLTLCEERATSLSHGAEGDAFEILHLCRHEEGHPGGEHQCGFCTFHWLTEVPC